MARMLRQLTFVIDMAPIGEGRARSAVSRRGTPFAYTPAKTRLWKRACAQQMAIEMGSAKPLSGMIELVVTAVFPAPKRRPKGTPPGGYCPSKPDWDNVGKIVSDAGNKIAWVDDRLIVDGRAVKRYAMPGESARVIVVAREL